jgi:hypothetical protein
MPGLGGQEQDQTQSSSRGVKVPGRHQAPVSGQKNMAIGDAPIKGQSSHAAGSVRLLDRARRRNRL